VSWRAVFRDGARHDERQDRLEGDVPAAAVNEGVALRWLEA